MKVENTQAQMRKGILEYCILSILEKKSVYASDIIKQLNLSQSAASRHLTQLSATGYLIERRCEGAKCYQLNFERVEATLHAIWTYLSD